MSLTIPNATALFTETDRILITLENKSDATLVELFILKLPDNKYIGMESICPHSGGPLYLGDIEDYEGNQCMVNTVTLLCCNHRCCMSVARVSF